MSNFTIAVLVHNEFGVLNRVTSMFRRRRFNIQSLTVSETESAGLSRITVTSSGLETDKKQLINQLYKLPDVCSIKELDLVESVTCELMLIKMKNDPETRTDIRDAAQARTDIRDAAQAFGAKTVDYTRDSITMRLTGTSREIDAFVDLMRDYVILEICRTGIVSLERGSTTISKMEI